MLRQQLVSEPSALGSCGGGAGGDGAAKATARWTPCKMEVDGAGRRLVAVPCRRQLDGRRDAAKALSRCRCVPVAVARCRRALGAAVP